MQILFGTREILRRIGRSQHMCHRINNKENFNLTSFSYWLSTKMFQATNPPTLKLKLKLAVDDVSFGSESTSECENVKKERLGDEAEDTVFDVKEKIIQLLKEHCCILDHIIKAIELQEFCAKMRKKILQNEKTEMVDRVILNVPEIGIEMSTILIQLIKDRRHILDQIIKAKEHGLL
jgi:hypothetical protein